MYAPSAEPPRSSGAIHQITRLRLGGGADPLRKVEQVARTFDTAAQRDQEGLDRIMHYAQSTSCRWRLLLEHFHEEPEFEGCGHCDNCLHPMD